MIAHAIPSPLMPPPAAAPRRRITGEGLLFAVLLILHVAPIWAFRFIPTQDGPGHQALAFILRQYGRPDAGLLRHYYALNREALPNWFIFFLLTRVLRFLAVQDAGQQEEDEPVDRKSTRLNSSHANISYAVFCLKKKKKNKKK